MIIALESAIAYLRGNAGLSALVGDRVADKHRFGVQSGDWPVPSSAVQVRYDGGGSELYLTVQVSRLEITCYGKSRYEATKVYNALVTACRASTKVPVQTTQGKALVYWMNLVSAPSVWRDADVNVDGLLVFAEICVAETDVL